MAVVIVVAYLFTRTTTYHEVLDRRLRLAGTPAPHRHLRRLLRLGHAGRRRDPRAASPTRATWGRPSAGCWAAPSSASAPASSAPCSASPWAASWPCRRRSAHGGRRPRRRRRLPPLQAPRGAGLGGRAPGLLHGVGPHGLNLLIARPFDEVLALVREVIRAMYPRQRDRHGPVRLHRAQRGARAADARPEGAHGGRAQRRPRHPARHRAHASSRRSPSARSSTCTPHWSRPTRSAATSTTSSCSTTTTCAWRSATCPARACRPRCSWPSPSPCCAPWATAPCAPDDVPGPRQPRRCAATTTRHVRDAVLRRLRPADR